MSLALSEILKALLRRDPYNSINVYRDCSRQQNFTTYFLVVAGNKVCHVKCLNLFEISRLLWFLKYYYWKMFAGQMI